MEGQRQVDKLCSLMVVLMSLSSVDVLKIPSAPWADNLQRLVVNGSFILLHFWIMAASTTAYARYRNTIMIIARVVLYSLPICREPQFILTRLDMLPGNTIGSYFKETIRILVASGPTHLLLMSIMLPLNSLSMHLALQCVALAGIARPSTVCGSRLFTSPTYIHRFRFIAEVLQTVRSIFTFGSVYHIQAYQGSDCESIILFVHLICAFVIPTYVLLKMAPPTMIERVRNSRIEQGLVKALSGLCVPNIKFPIANRIDVERIKPVHRVFVWLCLITTMWTFSCFFSQELYSN